MQDQQQTMLLQTFAQTVPTPSHANAKLDTSSDQSASQHSPGCDVTMKMEQILEQTDELIAQLPPDDPMYKDELRKLFEIRAYIMKKIHPDSKWNKLRFQRKRTGSMALFLKHDDSEEDDESAFGYGASQSEVVQDIVNRNLDDSIVSAIDDLICAFEYVKNLISK